MPSFFERTHKNQSADIMLPKGCGVESDPAGDKIIRSPCGVIQMHLQNDILAPAGSDFDSSARGEGDGSSAHRPPVHETQAYRLIKLVSKRRL